MSRQEDFIEAGIRYRMEHGKPMCIAGSNLADVERDLNRVMSFEEGAEYGYQYALQHPHWIPVEERLPKINDVASSWDCSDDVYIYLATRSYCVGRYEHDKSTNEFYWVLYGVDKDIPVTHWMPLPTPPRKED